MNVNRSTKTLVLVIFAAAAVLSSKSQQSSVVSTSANSRYFPTGVFEQVYKHSIRDKWYSNALRSLQEPSLFALRNDPSLQIYRFLRLSSFGHPISVRLTINADGSSSIVTRSVDNSPGFLTNPASVTGRLIMDTSTPVDKEQTEKVLEHLQRVAFWEMTTDEEEQPRRLGSRSHTAPVLRHDGSQWILEGIRGGKYHVVDRWSPKQNPYSQICKYLLRLGKAEPTLY